MSQKFMTNISYKRKQQTMVHVPEVHGKRPLQKKTANNGTCPRSSWQTSLIEENISLHQLGSFCPIFSFLPSGLQIILCLFWVIVVLSVLRYTASDYHFDIFNLRNKTTSQMTYYYLKFYYRVLNILHQLQEIQNIELIAEGVRIEY